MSESLVFISVFEGLCLSTQIAKWVREELCSEGTKHFFDVWHVGKSMYPVVGSLL